MQNPSVNKHLAAVPAEAAASALGTHSRRLAGLVNIVFEDSFVAQGALVLLNCTRYATVVVAAAPAAGAVVAASVAAAEVVEVAEQLGVVVVVADAVDEHIVAAAEFVAADVEASAEV